MPFGIPSEDFHGGFGLPDRMEEKISLQSNNMENNIKYKISTSYDIDDEDDWEEFRAEAHAFIKEKEETLIKKWLDKIGYKGKEPIGYYRNSWKREMEIYSTRVGALIGKAGVNVDLLEKMLADKFRGEWKVKFVEIRGGFITV